MPLYFTHLVFLKIVQGL